MTRSILLASTLALAMLAGCGDDTGGSGSGSGGGGTTGSGSGGGGGATTGSGSGNGSGDGSGTGSGTTTSTTATTATTGGEGGGGLLGFGETCTGNEQCESDLCYAFGMGSKCTVECPDDPADCPGTTKECNNMEPAVCKTP